MGKLVPAVLEDILLALHDPLGIIEDRLAEAAETRKALDLLKRQNERKKAQSRSAAGNAPEDSDQYKLLKRGEAWLEEQGRLWEAGKRPQLSRQEAVEEICRIFPVKTRWARLAWKGANLPPAWRIPGPRRKRR